MLNNIEDGYYIDIEVDNGIEKVNKKIYFSKLNNILENSKDKIKTDEEFYNEKNSLKISIDKDGVPIKEKEVNFKIITEPVKFNITEDIPTDNIDDSYNLSLEITDDLSEENIKTLDSNKMESASSIFKIMNFKPLYEGHSVFNFYFNASEEDIVTGINPIIEMETDNKILIYVDDKEYNFEGISKQEFSLKKDFCLKIVMLTNDNLLSSTIKDIVLTRGKLVERASRKNVITNMTDNVNRLYKYITGSSIKGYDIHCKNLYIFNKEFSLNSKKEIDLLHPEDIYGYRGIDVYTKEDGSYIQPKIGGMIEVKKISSTITRIINNSDSTQNIVANIMIPKTDI